MTGETTRGARLRRWRGDRAREALDRIQRWPRWAGPGPVVVFGGLIAVVAWPSPPAAITGLDASWRAALHFAAAHRLAWGTDLVFTYGPLGFLTVPWPIYGPTSILAIIFSGAVFSALAMTALGVLRRSLSLPIAAVVTFLLVRAVAIALPPAEQAAVLAVVLAVEALRRRSVGLNVVIAGGVAAGIAALIKLSLAITLIAVAAIVVLAVAPRRPRTWLAFLAFGAASFLGGWLATGQAIGDVVPYVRGSLEIVAGYNAAMTRPLIQSRMWVLPALAVAWAIVALGAWLLARAWPRSARIGLAAVVAVVLFVQWKLALRPFPTYVAATAAGVLIAVLGGFRRREIALAVAALLVVNFGVTETRLDAFLAPRQSARTAVTQLAAAIRIDFVDERAAATRLAIRGELAIPIAVSDALAGRTTHIEPFEADVATAYPDIVWRPLPVFQSYSAYTAPLDRMNADMLASDGAPERILREYFIDPGMTIHGRFRWFESPATNLEMLCRYREAIATEHWEVLERIDDRCGDALPIGSVQARVGQPVEVPRGPADSIVVAKVTGIDASPTDRLRTLFLRAQDWFARLDGRPSYRLVVDTARNGLILEVPSSADYSGPFAYGPRVNRITIGRNQSMSPGNQVLTYEFVAVPVAHR
ncbi:MAG TPA: hypothetical protein VFY18_00335 [Candidatus Limnocylindrales bacterium]|nr:hypothetical protein [Candidatus Limnocylindrales bacterium]